MRLILTGREVRARVCDHCNVRLSLIERKNPNSLITK